MTIKWKGTIKQINRAGTRVVVTEERNRIGEADEEPMVRKEEAAGGIERGKHTNKVIHSKQDEEQYLSTRERTGKAPRCQIIEVNML